MKFKTNSKFNIKIHNQYKNMIFTRFRDTDLKKKKKAMEEEPKNPQISSFPHHANGFELTIEVNGDHAEEEDAVEDEDKEEAAVELDGDDCANGFTGFVEGSGRIYGLKGKNKEKCPLSPNMLHWQANCGLIVKCAKRVDIGN